MKPNFTMFTAAALCALMSAPAIAQDTGLDTEPGKYSYALGYGVGAQLKAQFGSENMEVDAEIFTQAIRDALTEAEPALDPTEMQAVIVSAREKQMAEAKAQADEAMKAEQAFLEENGARDGVVTTDTGLQYEIVKAGDGAKPTTENTVVVHYSGKLLDGTEFDSSYKRNEPAEFQLGGVIPGWQEALQLMKEGATWKVYIPSQLAYGAKGAGNRIGPNETLVFDIELLEVK